MNPAYRNAAHSELRNVYYNLLTVKAQQTVNFDEEMDRVVGRMLRLIEGLKSESAMPSDISLSDWCARIDADPNYLLEN